jgi:hypothetical protein
MTEGKQFRLGIAIFVLGLLSIGLSVFWPILVLPGFLCLIFVPLKFSFPGSIGRGHMDQRFFNLILVVMLLAILLPVAGKIRKAVLLKQDSSKLHQTAQEPNNPPA